MQSFFISIVNISPYQFVVNRFKENNYLFLLYTLLLPETLLIEVHPIFLYASSLKGKKINNFTLSKVMRFFETGVKSYFGEQLVEFGFPVDAIFTIIDALIRKQNLKQGNTPSIR